jgi:alpha-mannosidase
MSQNMRIASVEPSVFFVRDGQALRQLVRLQIENSGAERAAVLHVRAGDVDERLPLGDVPPGTAEREVYLPDLRDPVQLTLGLWAGDALEHAMRLDWRPQRHWEVHLFHYSHHDLGYTGLPWDVLAEHADFIDEVLDYCEETENWPDDVKFRWMAEQAYSVVHFCETRPEEAVERLMHFTKSGQIEITALLGNMTMELCGHEELARLLYPSFKLRRDYGIDIVTAEHNDVPGFSWGLASVLASAGVKYFLPGIPSWYFGRGEERVHPCWNEEAVLPLDMIGGFWWEGPDGARVLLWHDLHGEEWQPTSYQHALRELPGMLGRLGERGYLYDMVSYMIRGGHRDNAPPGLRSAYIAKEWNSRWAYPRLITSTPKRYLGALEQRFGDTLRILRGDVPGTDYSVAATCTAKETAINRNTHDGLLTAEKLATLASIVTDYPYPRKVLDEAYRDALYYDEHCWAMYDPGGPAMEGDWSEKAGFAYRAAALVHDVTVKAANRTVDAIGYPEDGYYLTVFNPLAWERTDIVRAPLRAWAPAGFPMHWAKPRAEGEGPALVAAGAIGRGIVNAPAGLLDQPFELIDVSTGRPAPFQIVTLRDPQAARPWAPERVALGKIDPRHLSEIVFLAEGLPALGYKTYRIMPSAQWPRFDDTSRAGGQCIENHFFRLQLDPDGGTIASLFDKELGHELVDRDAAHGFGQMIVRSCETGEVQTGRIVEVGLGETGPICSTFTLKGEAPGCPRWTQEITLYHVLKRLDVGARILRDSTPMLEVYFAFPFRVKSPQFRFEAVDSIIEPTVDQLPGSNTDYYAVQHWADVSGDGWGVTWTPIDTPMTEFGGLWPGYVSGAHHGVTPPGYGHPFLRPGELTKGHIYSLVMYNNFRTNFINVHPGETLVRYSIGAHSGDWRSGKARELGWNAATPPVTVWMEGPQQGRLEPAASWCQIDDPNVMLLAFKRAEDGNGFVLRLIETAGAGAEPRVTLPLLDILHAYETNLVEENRGLLPCMAHSVQANLKPFGIATIRLVTR